MSFYSHPTPLFSSRQKQIIKRKKSKNNLFCHRCGSVDQKNIFKCYCCEHNYCFDCIELFKSNIALNYLSYDGICSDHRLCSIHSHENPSHHMTHVQLYDHISSQFKHKTCSDVRCFQRPLCPQCLFALQNSFCVECASETKAGSEIVKHYCQRCISKKTNLSPINPELITHPMGNIFEQKAARQLIYHDRLYQDSEDTRQLITTVCSKHLMKLC